LLPTDCAGSAWANGEAVCPPYLATWLEVMCDSDRLEDGFGLSARPALMTRTSSSGASISSVKLDSYKIHYVSIASIATSHSSLRQPISVSHFSKSFKNASVSNSLNLYLRNAVANVSK